MVEIDIDKLHEEIEERIQERGLAMVLNNFRLRLPIDDFSIERLETLSIEQLDVFGFQHRALSTLLGRLDIPHNQIKGCVKQLSDPEAPGFWRPSEKFMDQTDRQFYETIDSVVNRMNVEIPERPAIGDTQEWMEYNLILKPIYIKLREMGYSQGDLTA